MDQPLRRSRKQEHPQRRAEPNYEADFKGESAATEQRNAATESIHTWLTSTGEGVDGPAIPSTISDSSYPADNPDSGVGTTGMRSILRNTGVSGETQFQATQSTKKIRAPQKTYTCETCGKVFLRIKHFQNHQEMHKDPYSLRCDVCHHSARNRETLKVHLLVHKPGKTGRLFNCYKCSAPFGSGQGRSFHEAKCAKLANMLDIPPPLPLSSPAPSVPPESSQPLKPPSISPRNSKLWSIQVMPPPLHIQPLSLPSVPSPHPKVLPLLPAERKKPPRLQPRPEVTSLRSLLVQSTEPASTQQNIPPPRIMPKRSTLPKLKPRPEVALPQLYNQPLKLPSPSSTPNLSRILSAPVQSNAGTGIVPLSGQLAHFDQLSSSVVLSLPSIAQMLSRGQSVTVTFSSGINNPESNITNYPTFYANAIPKPLAGFVESLVERVVERDQTERPQTNTGKEVRLPGLHALGCQSSPKGHCGKTFATFEQLLAHQASHADANSGVTNDNPTRQLSSQFYGRRSVGLCDEKFSHQANHQANYSTIKPATTSGTDFLKTDRLSAGRIGSTLRPPPYPKYVNPAPILQDKDVSKGQTNSTDEFSSNLHGEQELEWKMKKVTSAAVWVPPSPAESTADDDCQIIGEVVRSRDNVNVSYFDFFDGF